MILPLKCLRVMLLLLGLAVIATACVPFVGNGPDEETPTPGVIPTVIPIDRPTPPATTSPVPTLVPLPTRAQQSATAPPSCTPRTDWPTYTVQSGDTLYNIAQLTDSTQAIIQAANCLADPNTIFEGQTLRVPQELAPSSPTPTAAPAAPAAPVATQPPFFPSPTAATGGVTFTFIAANGTATEDSQGSYRATEDPVRLSISVTNASRFDVVRADGMILDSAQAASGVANVGGTFTLRRIDILEGSNNLIITVKALTPNGTTVESAPIRIYWP